MSLTDASGKPVTREEADKAYRTVRACMIFGAVWFIGIVVVSAILDFDGWQILAGVVIPLEGVVTPLFLRYYRRELDRRVRASEEALGKVVALEDS